MEEEIQKGEVILYQPNETVWLKRQLKLSQNLRQLHTLYNISFLEPSYKHEVINVVCTIVLSNEVLLKKTFCG